MTAKQKAPLAGGAGDTAFDGEIIAEVLPDIIKAHSGLAEGGKP